MSKYGTGFVETEALLAAQYDDDDYMEKMLHQLLPGERRKLEIAAVSLAEAIKEMDRP